MWAFSMKQLIVVFLVLFTLSGTSASMSGSDAGDIIILKKEEQLAQMNAVFTDLVSAAEEEISLPELTAQNTPNIVPEGDERSKATK